MRQWVQKTLPHLPPAIDGWQSVDKVVGGLKMSSAQMKPTEQQILWKLVKADEQRPLSAADLAMTFY